MGCGVWGVGCWAWGLGLEVWGSNPGSWFRVQGFGLHGFMASSFMVSGFMVPGFMGSGFMTSGFMVSGFMVPGSGFGVRHLCLGRVRRLFKRWHAKGVVTHLSTSGRNTPGLAETTQTEGQTGFRVSVLGFRV